MRFYRDFSPEGTELFSWVVAMSNGFIIQVQVQMDKLRALNRYIEEKAWGPFRCQIFPSYNFVAITTQLKKDHS